ncbi:MAG: ion transporter [Clostridia bacterium]|nr:ion transporter [Clostridia bacterium]
MTINGGKKLKRLIAAGIGVYLLMLLLLVALESPREDAMIDTLPKAVWYSLVTLSSVGYGDMTPVTRGGKIVGGLFVIMSTGLLALLVGGICAAVTGRLYPRFRLWRHRRARWYVFAGDNAASRALSAGLTDGLRVFCGTSRAPVPDAVALDVSTEALLDLPFAAEGERVLFAMDDDISANERLAAAMQHRPVTVYCRGDGLDEALPGNVVLFGDAECAARLYWQTQPWHFDGERAALIGCGRFARALLLQGLLTAPPGCTIDLFGDWSLWRTVHGALDGAPDQEFVLCFHPEDWRACPDRLRDADRVTLCADDPEANRAALDLIRRYYVVPGRLHARCPRGLQDVWYFGDDASLFTPELVMKQALNALARQLHERYRQSVDYDVPPWEALPEFLKRSNLAAADHLMTKLRLLLREDVRALTPEACRRAAEVYGSAGSELKERCRYIEHARWCLFHALYNWQYAPVRDNALRRHPMLVPYAQLDEAERCKDDNAWLMFRELADRSPS